MSNDECCDGTYACFVIRHSSFVISFFASLPIFPHFLLRLQQPVGVALLLFLRLQRGGGTGAARLLLHRAGSLQFFFECARAGLSVRQGLETRGGTLLLDLLGDFRLAAPQTREVFRLGRLRLASQELVADFDSV